MVVSRGEEIAACSYSNSRGMWRDDDEGLDMADFQASVKPASHFLSFSEKVAEKVDTVKQMGVSLLSSVSSAVTSIAAGARKRVRASEEEEEECYNYDANMLNTLHNKGNKAGGIDDDADANDIGAGGAGKRRRIDVASGRFFK